jgi:rubrerythrin
MGIIFDASEVFQLAIRIEENGEKFYRKMAEKFAEPTTRQLFTFLADEEVGHKKIYQEILSTIETYTPHESYPGEYFAYLRSYADNIIFSQKEFDKKLETITDVMSALDFAINAEVSSILYYQEIKNIVPENKHHQIEKIVDEERKHFVMLSELKSQ